VWFLDETPINDKASVEVRCIHRFEVIFGCRQKDGAIDFLEEARGNTLLYGVFFGGPDINITGKARLISFEETSKTTRTVHFVVSLKLHVQNINWH